VQNNTRLKNKKKQKAKSKQDKKTKASSHEKKKMEVEKGPEKRNERKAVKKANAHCLFRGPTERW
jgi:hypothetical protein